LVCIAVPSTVKRVVGAVRLYFVVLRDAARSSA